MQLRWPGRRLYLAPFLRFFFFVFLSHKKNFTRRSKFSPFFVTRLFFICLFGWLLLRKTGVKNQSHCSSARLACPWKNNFRFVVISKAKRITIIMQRNNFRDVKLFSGNLDDVRSKHFYLVSESFYLTTRWAKPSTSLPRQAAAIPTPSPPRPCPLKTVFIIFFITTITTNTSTTIKCSSNLTHRRLIRDSCCRLRLRTTTTATRVTTTTATAGGPTTTTKLVRNRACFFILLILT